MHKGYIHIFPQITLFLAKYLAWSAVCVSVPMQPYIVEICDSLRGKIFQKFIERWDRGVEGWENWVEQFANILLNPHFPSPLTPKWQIYSFLPMEECGAQHPCEYTFLCVCFHWEWSGNTGGACGDVQHKTGILKKSIILGAAAGTRAPHFSVLVSHLSVSVPLSAIQPGFQGDSLSKKYSHSTHLVYISTHFTYLHDI